MKTILFHITYLRVGGIEKVLLELLQNIDTSKYKVMLSLGYKLDELEVLKEQIPPYADVHYLLEKPSLTKLKKKKLAKKLSIPEKLWEELVLPPFKKKAQKKKLKQLVQQADVVVDFDMTLAGYAKHIDKKKIAYCHFSLSHYLKGKKRKLDRLTKRLSRYDKVVMLCDEMRNEAVRMYPFLGGKAVRLYNALNFENIQKLSTEPLGEYEYLKEQGYFLALGRLDESQKDFTTVIKAYAHACHMYELNVPLVIAGDGKSKEQLQSLAHTEGVSDQVIFAGYQTNPYKWMRHCSLFLFGSKYEGLPTVLIEALSLGKPTIATECPTGVAELLMHGKAGWLVPVADTDAMTEAIYKLHNNKNLQQKCAENAKEFLPQFNIKHVMSAFENIIEQ